jgi:hypothetical protein
MKFSQRFLLFMMLVWPVSKSLSQTTNDQLQTILQQKIDSVREAIDIPSMAFTCVLPSGKLISVASGMKPDQRMLACSTG